MECKQESNDTFEVYPKMEFPCPAEEMPWPRGPDTNKKQLFDFRTKDNTIEIGQDGNCDPNADKSKFNIKQEDLKCHKSWNLQSNKKKTKKTATKQTADYHQITVNINFTCTTYKEEPIEMLDDIFKHSPLESEKEQFHQQIVAQLYQNSIKLRELQAQYIEQLHKVSNIEIFSCSLCTYETMNITNLKCHLFLIHDAKSKADVFKCNHCQYQAKFQCHIIKHMQSHTKIKNKYLKSDTTCVKKCSCKGVSLNKKKSNKDKLNNEFFKCSECEFKSECKDDLKSHRSSVHTDPKYICETCGLTMRYLKTYQEHLISHKKWEEIDWFQCYHCPFQSKTKRNLYRHIKIGKHSPTVKPKINPQLRKKRVRKNKDSCELCAFPTDNKSYSEHIKSHREGDRWKCFQCDYKNLKKSQIGIHLQEVHQFENEASKRAKMCEVCSKSFAQVSYLKKHQLSHKDITDLSDTEVHKCPECNQKFKQKRTLQLHLLTHKEPKHVCKVCGFATRHARSFRNHQILHLDDNQIKWYKCKLCSYQGRTNKLLWQHMKKGDHSDRYGPAHLRRSRKVYEPSLTENQTHTQTQSVELDEPNKMPVLRFHDIFSHNIF